MAQSRFVKEYLKARKDRAAAWQKATEADAAVQDLMARLRPSEQAEMRSSGEWDAEDELFDISPDDSDPAPPATPASTPLAPPEPSPTEFKLSPIEPRLKVTAEQLADPDFCWRHRDAIRLGQAEMAE
jgi:hypothetical protein